VLNVLGVYRIALVLFDSETGECTAAARQANNASLMMMMMMMMMHET